MSVNARRLFLLSGSAALALAAALDAARAQDAPVTTLHEIVVTTPRAAPARPAPSANTAATPAPTEAEQTAQAMQDFDSARDNFLLPKIGVTSYNINQDAIQALPQGGNTPFDKVLLQAPGVSQDSAASGALHVRNEHANVQYRINGILLPDGISGFGQVLETGFVGTMALVTGALPAQYGLRTSGLFDITTRTRTAPGGNVTVYGGSNNTFTSAFDYGGVAGKTEYFVAGRYFGSELGIENPTSGFTALHDNTAQGKGFAYVSTIIDPSTRVSFIGGTTYTQFQIPNNPNQSAFDGITTVNGIGNYDSAALNERQYERNDYAVLAMQKKALDWDMQIAYFNRYSSVHFEPDPFGDIFFNGVASDVMRRSFVNGVQGDMAYRLNEAHTLRYGFTTSAEQTMVDNSSLVLRDTLADTPFGVTDNNSKTGWIAGVYLQDEWRITDKLTLNAGLRFDQMWQFIDANQLSPRVNVVYKPFETTTIHAGYARYFTPPPQVVATPVNLAAFAGTSAAPATNQADPVLPERSHYFDAGIVQQVLPGLQVGVDAYYKIAKDLLDDGQFGAALVLSGFNYEKGVNKGIEFSATYTRDNLQVYGNVAIANQKATNIVSNQYLIDPDDLAYIANHWIYTDHSQSLTASAGASYLWNGTRYSADLIYGSGLRADSADGVPNGDHVPAYTQVNVGASHEFVLPDKESYTLRFDVVNLFDEVYEIRDGSGIGVFAPQYGPRRTFFVGLSKKL